MFPSKIVFDDFFDEVYQKTKGMNCDIYEEGGLYHIEMDAPGFKKEDIQIECDQGNLKIIAVKKNDEKAEKKFLHRERKTYEKCERSFYLGSVNEDAITANFKDGILEIIVPKEKQTNTKKNILIN